jgi:hypothetical protein
VNLKPTATLTAFLAALTLTITPALANPITFDSTYWGNLTPLQQVYVVEGMVAGIDVPIKSANPKLHYHWTKTFGTYQDGITAFYAAYPLSDKTIDIPMYCMADEMIAGIGTAACDKYMDAVK